MRSNSIPLSRAIERWLAAANPPRLFEVIGFPFGASRDPSVVEPLLLPSLPHNSLAVARKADLAIAFSPYDEDVGPAIQSYLHGSPDIALSQMQDAYTSTIPLVCGIEVKQAGGDSNEGLTQLAIWSTAGLEKTEQLRRRRIAHDIRGIPLPVMGVVVVGHTWDFYMIWREESGKRVGNSRLLVNKGENKRLT